MDGAADTSLTVSEGRLGGRIVALDALRGVAVAGIVWMNVIAFSMPAAAYVDPRAYGGLESLDIASWAAVFVLVEDKFRALFAMLFGAGVTILLDKTGPNRLGGHYARMAVLFLIGWLHALLLANNDILRVYAVGGLVLPMLVHWRPRLLLWAAAGLIAAQMAVAAWYYREAISFWLAATDIPVLGLDRVLGMDADTIAAALQRGQEGLGERIQRRVAGEPDLTMRVMAGLPSSLAAMLIGIALWRTGLLRGDWKRERAIRLFYLTSIPALIVLAAMALLVWVGGFDALVSFSISLIWSAPFDLLLAIGWAALFMALFHHEGALTRLWAAAGRMALTNYLLTSLIFAALFASWGLGLFGAVGRIEAYLLCLLPIAVMLFLSQLWLTLFRQGPTEWAWRCIAQLRLLPLRR